MAKGSARYLIDFLRGPEGGFYASQDADVVPGEHAAEYFAMDDAGRRRLGMPRIDLHQYARENGWAIQGLVQLYEASGENYYFEAARNAAFWAIHNRSLARNPFIVARWLASHRNSPMGGFSHDAEDPAGPYLGDSLAMGKAFLELYGATAERRWLHFAEASARFIWENFRDPAGQPGFVTARTRGILTAPPILDENIAAVRFLNLLSRYTGNEEYKRQAEAGMRYLATPQIALQRLTDPGILLADEELRSDPTHISIVGPKNDAQAAALFRAALRFPSNYRRVEWWDRREGAMPNPDVQYPEMAKSAAFVCSNRLCSSPVFEPEKIRERVERLSAR